MSAPDTPDVARALAAPFTDGLRQGVLRYQHCSACGRAQTLARYACQHCGARGTLHWRDAAGTGGVHAVTEVARAPSDAFRALAPYTLAIVQLDEGPRLMGHATPGVRIGARVRAGFFEHQGVVLIRFEPVD
ncbi:OB-fold domain-containing protein [Pulveribacter sp.]|uniref:Zn-ribbon domain-containing OB-fold protein n=1 Tax=Pulveribacter sp. TaxID=2678893 RepID=UPI002898060C|nr:OB-fold domain-containing protein [Pulveribacter sp.]